MSAPVQVQEGMDSLLKAGAGLIEPPIEFLTTISPKSSICVS
jgi:hypothetical protein